MAAMRLKASATLRRKAKERKVKATKDAQRTEDLETTIHALKKKTTKVKKTKEDKHKEFFEMMDAYNLATKKRQPPKPKPKPPVKRQVQFAKQVPHPNRRVPTRFRPVPPPVHVPSGPFAHLFGSNKKPKVSWRS